MSMYSYLQSDSVHKVCFACILIVRIVFLCLCINIYYSVSLLSSSVLPLPDSSKECTLVTGVEGMLVVETDSVMGECLLCTIFVEGVLCVCVI